MLRVKSVYVLPLICLSLATLPAQAQSTGVGKRGMYGKSSVEEDPSAPAAKKPVAAAPAAPAAEKQPPLTEEQKRLQAKYPLSITEKTPGNQKAHDLLLKGVLLYNQTKAMFAAANEIKSTYAGSDYELEITQKGIVQARLQPADLLLYGPKYAYIGLRIRALQDADRLNSQSMASFSQAQSMAPYLSLIPKWIRITQDTQKAIRYHIRFYQLSLKAVNLGYTEKELKSMALRWKAPLLDDPNATLITRVNTRLFESTRGASENGKGVMPPSLDNFVSQLPTLDFQVGK